VIGRVLLEFGKHILVSKKSVYVDILL